MINYLYITSAEALRRLIGWMSLAADIGENSSLEVRLAVISKLQELAGEVAGENEE